MKSTNKSSFTLLEIVVVLFIMGLIYAVGVATFSKNMLEKEAYYDLKKVLLNKINTPNTLIELYILSDFSAILTKNGTIVDDNFELPQDIEFFTFLQDDTLKDKFGYFLYDDYLHEVVFKYTIYPNGSSTKAIIRINDWYYTYFSYFEDLQKFEYLYEAQEYLLQNGIKNSMVVVND